MKCFDGHTQETKQKHKQKACVQLPEFRESSLFSFSLAQMSDHVQQNIKMCAAVCLRETNLYMLYIMFVLILSMSKQVPIWLNVYSHKYVYTLYIYRIESRHHN